MNCSEENTPPQSEFSYYPVRADSTTVFTFDASLCSDTETSAGGLLVRWDWESDGIWDTDFSRNKIIAHVFNQSGFFNVSLEVKDRFDETDVTVQEVLVGKSLVSTITDIRDGRIYKTVKIGDQWWFSENLKIGKMIDYNYNQRNNGIIEKYAYNNDSNYCEEFGGLYQWKEAMNYSIDTAARGICPVGWHIPTKYEWQKLFDIIPFLYDNLIGESGLYGVNFKQNLYELHYYPPFNGVDEFRIWSNSGEYYLTSELEYHPQYWQSYWPIVARPWINVFGIRNDLNALALRCVKNSN